MGLRVVVAAWAIAACSHGSDHAGTRGGGDAPVTYHGGRVMVDPVQLYVIWYGRWVDTAARPIIDDFATELGHSAYWAINTTYTDGENQHVSSDLTLAGETDAFSRGVVLAMNDIPGLVRDAIDAGTFPLDPGGIYVVLTSIEITTPGLCSADCGYHLTTSIDGVDAPYVLVGDPGRCPQSCLTLTSSPNDDAHADGLISLLAHELDETVTDPDGDAWFDDTDAHDENADKCAWTFGPTYATANGAVANVKVGDRDFFIQQNWVNAHGGYCAVAYP
jgi:hypothetical protein